MEEGRKEHDRKMAKIIARVWSDESFKKHLLTNPLAVLQEYEIAVPEGIEVKVVEQTNQVMYIVLPPKPDVESLIKPVMSEDTDEIACARCV